MGTGVVEVVGTVVVTVIGDTVGGALTGIATNGPVGVASDAGTAASGLNVT